MINKEKALALLEGFKAEYDFVAEPPAELIEFAKCLGWEEVGEKTTRSLVLWSGENFISGFLDKWEHDQEISKEEGISISQEHLNNVGLAVKYEFAWEIITTILFLKSDLPRELLLESSNDLECSVILSKERYFKQAFQVLRNYCEISVSIMYFLRNRDKYQEWLNDKKGWHFPDYRMMLDKLAGYLEDDKTTYLRKCYGKLNHSVHSKRSRLNMNIGRLDRATRDFYCQDIVDWSEQFKRIAKFMLELYIRKYF